MSRRSKSSTLIPVFAMAFVIVTIIALSLALWLSTLRLNTVVDTGEVNVDYRNVLVEEFEEAESKDVGSCTCTIDTSDATDHLKIVVFNGYPGYGCTVHFEVVNTGTIPVVGPFYNITEIPNGVKVEFYPPNIQQLHPGESTHYKVTVEVLQEANENSTYVVDVSITYIQWNEAYSSISGYVWNDANSNGLWDLNEDPVGGVQILLKQNGVVKTSTYTNAEGYYFFAVFPGTYNIEIVIPMGYFNTTASIIVRTVYAGESSVNNNFGITQLPTPPLPELNVTGEFRKTDVNLNVCPAKLGTLLNYVEATVPGAGPKKGKVTSVSPGAFYHIMWIKGAGFRNINVTITYDYQFNIEDGVDGKVRVYMLNTTTMCIIRELDNRTYSYSVDNMLNRAVVNITLNTTLPPDAVILIYTKFKPTDYHPINEPYGLVGHDWVTLDKFFDIYYDVVTSIGSISGSNKVEIIKK